MLIAAEANIKSLLASGRTSGQNWSSVADQDLGGVFVTLKVGLLLIKKFNQLIEIVYSVI